MAKKINLTEMTLVSPYDGATHPLSEYLTERDVFRKQNMAIITHNGMRKLANAMKIREVDVIPMCQPTLENKQKHWVKVVIEDDNGKVTCKTGEADMLNTGKWFQENGQTKYKELYEIDCQYRGSMAEKRGFDRAVIAHLQIYGAYSEVEFAAEPESPVKAAVKSVDVDEETATVLDAGTVIDVNDL